MARPRHDQRKFAELYVKGPAFARGNWNVCATGAGMKEPPPRDDATLRGLIERLGGTPPPLPDCHLEAAEAQANAEAEAAALDAAVVLVEAPTPLPAAEDAEELDPIAALAAAADLGLPWAQMRDKLQDVILSVANGTVRATAAQVSMLKYIVEQAKADASSSERILGVVLLPTQDTGANMRLQPAMRKRAEERLRAQEPS